VGENVRFFLVFFNRAAAMSYMDVVCLPGCLLFCLPACLAPDNNRPNKRTGLFRVGGGGGKKNVPLPASTVAVGLTSWCQSRTQQAAAGAAADACSRSNEKTGLATFSAAAVVRPFAFMSTFRGCLHVRFPIRIPIRFGARFAAKGVQQVKKKKKKSEMCKQTIVMGDRKRIRSLFCFLTNRARNRMAIRMQIRTLVDSPLARF
jgi:hypothetical protein